MAMGITRKKCVAEIDGPETGSLRCLHVTTYVVAPLHTLRPGATSRTGGGCVVVRPPVKGDRAPPPVLELDHPLLRRSIGAGQGSIRLLGRWYAIRSGRTGGQGDSGSRAVRTGSVSWVRQGMPPPPPKAGLRVVCRCPPAAPPGPEVFWRSCGTGTQKSQHPVAAAGSWGFGDAWRTGLLKMGVNCGARPAVRRARACAWSHCEQTGSEGIWRRGARRPPCSRRVGGIAQRCLVEARSCQTRPRCRLRLAAGHQMAANGWGCECSAPS